MLNDSIRERFSKNAEEFDSLLVEILEENESLKRSLKSAQESLRIQQQIIEALQRRGLYCGRS